MSDNGEKAKSSLMSKPLLIVIGVVMLVVVCVAAFVILRGDGDAQEGGATSASALSYPSTYFDSPEAAIEAYVKAMSSADLMGLLATVSIDDYAANYNLAEESRRKKIILALEQNGPSEYPLYREMNKLDIAAKVMKYARYLAYSFNSTAPLNGMSIDEPTDEKIAAFIASVDPAKLKELKIETIGSMKILSNADTKENSARRAFLLGADELTERVVLYELGGKEYWGGFTLLKYKRGWKIFLNQGAYAGQNPYCTATRCTKEEFETLLGK